MRKDNEKLNRYGKIIESIFLKHYKEGAKEVAFERQDIEYAAGELGIKLPKNLGDVVYSFRYRTDLPDSIKRKAPIGLEWIILPKGRALYSFVASSTTSIVPSQNLAETKIPDSTPGIIESYALSDEQALLAKLRYNRLIDIFSGITCYSLQNHLRTAVLGMGQVETDEIYVGVDKRGAHYVFPVQAKGGRDRLSIVQIAQDFALCEEKFPSLICRPIAAQFMSDNLIALFEFEMSNGGFAISCEKHYRLVEHGELSMEEIQAYSKRLS
ncbi:MAG: endonuclease [Armatimonadota bacterium]